MESSSRTTSPSEAEKSPTIIVPLGSKRGQNSKDPNASKWSYHEKGSSNLMDVQIEKKKQVIRVQKLVGLPPPALELLGRLS